MLKLEEGKKIRCIGCDKFAVIKHMNYGAWDYSSRCSLCHFWFELFSSETRIYRFWNGAEQYFERPDIDRLREEILE